MKYGVDLDPALEKKAGVIFSNNGPGSIVMNEIFEKKIKVNSNRHPVFE